MTTVAIAAPTFPIVVTVRDFGFGRAARDLGSLRPARCSTPLGRAGQTPRSDLAATLLLSPVASVRSDSDRARGAMLVPDLVMDEGDVGAGQHVARQVEVWRDDHGVFGAS